MTFKPTIGLEIHIELNTRSKMFCPCLNDPDQAKPNVNVCPICLAHPGALPVINQEAVNKVIKTGLALNCQITPKSFFERKNYFYPDLPKGYQISQYQSPLAKNGYFKIANGKKVRIERIHLEEDTGKLLHQTAKKYSLVDFNRAGVPLMELVSQPDINSTQEARSFIKELQTILRYLNVSSANMEKGEMRAEVNISLRPAPDGAGLRDVKTQNSNVKSKLGTKVEIKNLNSLRAVEKSIDYEIKRQGEILNRGEKVSQETRGWHDLKEITFSQREKEKAHDYRYFPEPDLPPLQINQELINQIKKEIPELPANKRERFQKEYGLSLRDIELYISQRDLGEYFEKVISELLEWVKSKKLKTTLKNENKLIRLASNYITTDLQALLKGGVFQEGNFPITAENFAEFLSLIYLRKLSSRLAKDLLKEMFETGRDPSQLIEEKGLKQVTDQVQLEKAAKKAIEENKKAVNDFQQGKESALQFLIGQVMRQTKGKGSPQIIRQIIKKLLQ